MTLADWAGTLGVFLILLAYSLNVTGKLKSDGRTFLLLNFIGASLACVASFMISYLPFVILEGAWASVSLVALIRSATN
jgi:hypothetical protein